MIVSVLVAVAKNGVIGNDNRLIWKLSGDLKNFKRLTMGHPVVMGRKTFDAIGRPLPGRGNIIVSRSKDLEIPGCEVVNSLESALELAGQKEGGEEVFIIGGADIYRQALPFANKIYLTLVDAYPEGDAYFDAAPYTLWQETSKEIFKADGKNQYDFEILTREKA